MSIASEIARLKTAKAAIQEMIENMGVSMPENVPYDELPNYISQIEGGGSASKTVDIYIDSEFDNDNHPYITCFGINDGYPTFVFKDVDVSDVSRFNIIFDREFPMAYEVTLDLPKSINPYDSSTPYGPELNPFTVIHVEIASNKYIGMNGVLSVKYRKPSSTEDYPYSVPMRYKAGEGTIGYRSMDFIASDMPGEHVWTNAYMVNALQIINVTFDKNNGRLCVYTNNSYNEEDLAELENISIYADPNYSFSINRDPFAYDSMSNYYYTTLRFDGDANGYFYVQFGMYSNQFEVGEAPLRVISVYDAGSSISITTNKDVDVSELMSKLTFYLNGDPNSVSISNIEKVYYSIYSVYLTYHPDVNGTLIVDFNGATVGIIDHRAPEIPSVYGYNNDIKQLTLATSYYGKKPSYDQVYNNLRLYDNTNGVNVSFGWGYEDDDYMSYMYHYFYFPIAYTPTSDANIDVYYMDNVIGSFTMQAESTPGPGPEPKTEKELSYESDMWSGDTITDEMHVEKYPSIVDGSIFIPITRHDTATKYKMNVSYTAQYSFVLPSEFKDGDVIEIFNDTYDELNIVDHGYVLSGCTITFRGQSGYGWNNVSDVEMIYDADYSSWQGDYIYDGMSNVRPNIEGVTTYIPDTLNDTHRNYKFGVGGIQDIIPEATQIWIYPELIKAGDRIIIENNSDFTYLINDNYILYPHSIRIYYQNYGAMAELLLSEMNPYSMSMSMMVSDIEYVDNKNEADLYFTGDTNVLNYMYFTSVPGQKVSSTNATISDHIYHHHTIGFEPNVNCNFRFYINGADQGEFTHVAPITKSLSQYYDMTDFIYGWTGDTIWDGMFNVYPTYRYGENLIPDLTSDNAEIYNILLHDGSVRLQGAKTSQVINITNQKDEGNDLQVTGSNIDVTIPHGETMSFRYTGSSWNVI